MTDLIGRLNHLVALNKPENGGPYGGFAAQQCVTAMSEAAAEIARLQKRVADLAADRRYSGDLNRSAYQPGQPMISGK